MLQSVMGMPSDPAWPSSVYLACIVGVVAAVCLSTLLFVCICLRSTANAFRNFHLTEDCFKRSGFVGSDRPKKPKSPLNGSSGTQGNGYFKIGNGSPAMTGARQSQSDYITPNNTLSRDRELPPVPPGQELPVSTYSLSSLPRSGLANDRPVLHQSAMPQQQVISMPSCGDYEALPADDVTYRMPLIGPERSRDTEKITDSQRRQQVISCCDTISELEVDPLYATVSPQFSNNKSVSRYSLKGGAFWRLSSGFDPPPINHQLVEEAAKTSAQCVYARIQRPKGERLVKLSSLPRQVSPDVSSDPPHQGILIGGRVGSVRVSKMHQSASSDNFVNSGGPSAMKPSDSYASITGPPIPSRAYGQSEVDLVAAIAESPEVSPTSREQLPELSSMDDLQDPSQRCEEQKGTSRRRERHAEAVPGSPRRYSQPLMSETSSQSRDSGIGQSTSTSGQLPSNSRSYDQLAEEEGGLTANQIAMHGPRRQGKGRNENAVLTQVYECLYETYTPSLHSVPKHRKVSEHYVELPDCDAELSSTTAHSLLKEMQSFRHMDSDVDISRTTPSPLPLNVFYASRAPSYRTKLSPGPVYPQQLVMPPRVPLAGMIASEEDLNSQQATLDVHPSKQHSQQIYLYQAKMMTPLMERSIEGSLLDENGSMRRYRGDSESNFSDGTTLIEEQSEDSNYAFLEDYTSGDALFLVGPKSELDYKFQSDIKSTKSHRQRNESEASSLL